MDLKTEVNLEEATGSAKAINLMTPCSQEVEIEADVNFLTRTVKAKTPVKVAEKFSKNQAKVPGNPTKIKSKVDGKSSEKLPQTKAKVKDTKASAKSKPKRKSSSKSRLTPTEFKSQQAEVKKQLSEIFSKK